MLMDEYFSAMKGVLEKVEQTQRDTIIDCLLYTSDAADEL